MRLAEQQGLTWLLHIDSDELFYTPEPSVVQHFDWLDSQGILQLTYSNNEGVPEVQQCADSDYFEHVTLFKKHHLSLPLQNGVGSAMEWWKSRTNHGQYLIAYGKPCNALLPYIPVFCIADLGHSLMCVLATLSCLLQPHCAISQALPCAHVMYTWLLSSADCGKSAARVGCGAVPKSVHTWRIPNTATIANTTTAVAAVGPVSRTAIADPRNLCINSYLPLPAATAPCILHYVVCGYLWYCDKYALLGQFDSAWFGGKLPIAPCFHLDCRDAVQQQQHSSDTVDTANSSASDNAASSSSSSNSSSAARSLYDAQVAVCSERDAAIIARCLQLGVCERITEPQSVITKAKRDRTAAGSSGKLISSVDDTAVSSIAAIKPSLDGASAAAAATTTTEKPIAVAASSRSAEAAQALLIASIAGLQLSTSNSSSTGTNTTAAALPDAAADSTSTASTSSNRDTQGAAGYERAWILSSIARDYL
eukprot:7301-Heterococcus_DN1.PRE.1